MRKRILLPNIDLNTFHFTPTDTVIKKEYHYNSILTDRCLYRVDLNTIYEVTSNPNRLHINNYHKGIDVIVEDCIQYKESRIINTDKHISVTPIHQYIYQLTATHPRIKLIIEYNTSKNKLHDLYFEVMDESKVKNEFITFLSMFY